MNLNKQKFPVVVRLFSIALFLLLATIAADAVDKIDTYLVDSEHTEIGFEIKHLMISKVKGRFDKFQGTIELANDQLSKVQGTVEAASVNTNQEKRDKHLRSADFFDVEKSPRLTFEVSNLGLKKGETKKVKGQLTIHGVTRTEEIEIEFVGTTQDPWGTAKLVVNATAEINRKDYGLTWNQALETGGVMVSEKVKIEVNVQANKK